MTGKELLNRVRRGGKAVEAAKEAYYAIYHRLTSGTSNLRPAVVKSSGSGDEKMVAVVTALEKWESLRAEYNSLCEQAQELIERLEDDRHRRDLQYRYLCGYTAKETARKMHYSPQWEREVHRQAVRAFDEIYESKKEP